MNYKAETLANILNEAKEAKPIEGMPNTYTPEEYTKLFRANNALADLESGEFLKPQIDTGAYEYDSRTHRLKSIGRYRPAMLDLNVLTANLYQLENIERVEEYTTNEEVEDKDGKKKTKVVKKANTFNDKVIRVIFGRATVQAVKDLKEVGNSVKCQVFKKLDKEGADWEYIGSDLVAKDDAYKFTKSLEVKSALRLMRKMQMVQAEEAEVEGDNLDDVS